MQVLQPGAPLASDEAIASWYGFDPGIRLRSNMIVSADGLAVGPDGLSKGLSGAADSRLIGTLRALSHAVIVAAGTLRTERYRPLQTRDSLLAMRSELGLPPHPRLIVVTRSPRIDDSFPTLANSPVRPLVFCARNSGDLAEVADVVELPSAEGRVDLAAAIGHLHGLGYTRLHTEGGPQLLAGLLADGLVDEYCLTISPHTYGGPAGLRPVTGVAAPVDFALIGAAESDGFMFLRYRVAR